MMMKKAVRDGEVQPAKIGRDKVEVSHLQYTDDTLFVVSGDVENARAVKQLLEEFEVSSGLKVNFNKSCVFGINIEEDGMRERKKNGWRTRLGWWKGVVEDLEGTEGAWFWEKLEQKLGDGKDANFWDGMWSRDRSVKNLSPRLFLLSNKRRGNVRDMRGWVDGEWKWEFGWTRELRQT